jgi:hypothetical protein
MFSSDTRKGGQSALPFKEASFRDTRALGAYY